MGFLKKAGCSTKAGLKKKLGFQEKLGLRKAAFQMKRVLGFKKKKKRNI